MKNPSFRTYEPSDYITFGLESSHRTRHLVINIIFQFKVIFFSSFYSHLFFYLRGSALYPAGRLTAPLRPIKRVVAQWLRRYDVRNIAMSGFESRWPRSLRLPHIGSVFDGCTINHWSLLLSGFYASECYQLHTVDKCVANLQYLQNDKQGNKPVLSYIAVTETYHLNHEQ